MFNALDRVREKPRAQRQAIALGIAAVVTAVIFILWIVSFFASIQSDQEAVSPSEDGFGFDTFVNSFQEASNVIKQEVGAAKDQLELIGTELKKGEETPTSVDIEDKNEDVKAVQNTQPEAEITPSGIEIIQIQDQL